MRMKTAVNRKKEDKMKQNAGKETKKEGRKAGKKEAK